MTPCPFHELTSSHAVFNRQIWHRVAEQREDAYSIVCDVFGLAEIKEEIEDATSSTTIRFGDILHCLYHRTQNRITWCVVITEVNERDHSLGEVIRNAVQLY